MNDIEQKSMDCFRCKLERGDIDIEQVVAIAVAYGLLGMALEDRIKEKEKERKNESRD